MDGVVGRGRGKPGEWGVDGVVGRGQGKPGE